MGTSGPDDGAGCGLGIGGERLHYWVFGGPWSYASPERGEPTGDDKAWLEHLGVRQSPFATFIDYRVKE